MTMGAPVILITCDVREDRGHPSETLLSLRRNYAAAICAAGGVPLILPPEPAGLGVALDLCNGILLSGSDAGVTVPPLRHDFERLLIEQALARDLPILGVCHGMQVLGVVLGGKVDYADPALLSEASAHLPRAVPDTSAHEVIFSPGSRLVTIAGTPRTRVNSLHRHALRGPGRFHISATAPDGVVEGIEATGSGFCLGVQWHPEYLLTPTDTRLLHAFVAAAALHQSKSARKGRS